MKDVKRIFIAFILVIFIAVILANFIPVILVFLNENCINDLIQFACFYSTLNKKSMTKSMTKVSKKFSKDEDQAVELIEKDKSNGEIITQILTKKIINGIVFNKLNNEL